MHVATRKINYQWVYGIDLVILDCRTEKERKQANIKGKGFEIMR